MLTLKQLGMFFKNVISVSNLVYCKCSIFVWNWLNTVNSKPALWILMSWCFSNSSHSADYAPMRFQSYMGWNGIKHHQLYKRSSLYDIYCMILLSYYIMPCYMTLLPPPWRRLCFHRCPLLCLFVCVSVCLLATLRKNSGTDFHEICRVGGTWYKEQLGTFSRCSMQPLEHRIFSHFFGAIHAS